MKNNYILAGWKNKILSFLALLFCTLCVYAQDTLPVSISGSNTYSNPLGAVVLSGTTTTITTGANVTFMFDVTIEQEAKLIINGATVKMGNDKRIILEHYPGSDTAALGARLELNGNTVVESLTGLPTGALWRGIECKGVMASTSGLGRNAAAGLKITNSTIQYAQCAYTNFDPVLFPSDIFSAYGKIYGYRATFNNNIRSLNIYGSGLAYTSYPDIISWTSSYLGLSVFKLSSDFPYSPPDMVKVTAALVLQSCAFTGRGAPSYSSALNTTAINAINCILQVDQAIGSPSGCTFTDFRNGIVVTNGLNTVAGVVISNSAFDCRYAMNLSGCVNPLIVNNKSLGPTPIPPYDVNMEYCGIFLRNCPSYRIEGNALGYDIPSYAHNHAGIVLMNCGTANNEVYRNTLGMPQTISLGIQSVGTNKSMTGNAGVKFLCNDFKASNDYNISVMKDPAPNSNNGIHNLQFIQGSTQTPDQSAANLFVANPAASPYRNYYLESGTNTVSAFLYKYNPLVPNENPLYRTPFTALTTSANTCPVHNTRNPQPVLPYAIPATDSFRIYTEGLRTSEAGIGTTEARPRMSDSNTKQLEYYPQPQSDLIRRIVPYRENSDIAKIHADEQVTEEAHNQLMLASAYMSFGRFEDAISILDRIKDNYKISQEEEKQAGNLAAIFSTVQWLKQYNNDWTNIPDDLKAIVYDAEQNDPMYAGAIARSLLVEHEGKVYDPIFITPKEARENNLAARAFHDKIYPNPATKQLFVNWTGENATLMLTDIIGKVALQKEIKGGVTEIPINKLIPGIYSAQIVVNGKPVYQQKVVKK